MLIKNKERAMQLFDFTSLQSGNMHPMDMDGLIEYKDQKYLFYEFKLKGAGMPTGQRIAIERLVNDTAKAGKKSIAILCEHDVEDPEVVVDAGATVVRAAYYNGTWHPATCFCTAEKYTRTFLGEEYKGE